ncbi:Oleosin domain-containing protein [Cephalotus follicularis]|uniref:Oleosin domain-containing protein n=1 Tax=Cephalotus follicularis TaxID=3775 RepID=A0A1Q3BQS0_CEPFO|nr:Oleosin domain-containing protein [Cephalotus follicularis]
MADRERERERLHQIQVHPQQRYEGGMKSMLPQKRPSKSQVLAVVALLPVSGTLLALAALCLIGSIIGLCITTPLFIIFSPVLVPAAIAVGLSVTGFLASGTFGLTGLSSLSWVLKYFRQAAPEVKRRMEETTGYMTQKTREMGQEIPRRIQEGKEGK